VTDDEDDDDIQTVTSDWICKRLVIHRNTLHNIIAGDPTFPEAIVLVAGVRRWEKAAILRWIKAKKKSK
jgi:predicted DNA-binding transcriptional regulator AlpA